MLLQNDVYPTLLEIARRKTGLFTEKTDAFLKAARETAQQNAEVETSSKAKVSDETCGTSQPAKNSK